MKRISRWKSAAIMMAGSVAMALLMGLVLAAVTHDPGENFAGTLLGAAKMFYICFLGGFPVAALLIVCSKIEEDLAVKYGAGLYYGTLLCGMTVSSYVSASDTTCMVIGFIIAALICRVSYLKRAIQKNKQ